MSIHPNLRGSPRRSPRNSPRPVQNSLNSTQDFQDGDFDSDDWDERQDSSINDSYTSRIARSYDVGSEQSETGSPLIGWTMNEEIRARHRSVTRGHIHPSRENPSPNRSGQHDRSYGFESFSHRNERIIQKELPKQTNARVQSSDSDSNNLLYAVIGILVVAALGIGFLFGRSNQKIPAQCPEFKELTKLFTHQDIELWKSLKIGTEGVLNKDPTKPSVFLLAYNDKRTIDSVMDQVINATASCMNSKHPIILKSDALATDAMRKDYGEVIKSYKNQLKQEGIMYVADIDKVPIEAAKAFHAICDTVTPLVERLVVFFSMHLEHFDRTMSPQEILNLVESGLENNWYKEGVINDNTLKALIGRITDQVFLLHSET